LHRPPAGQRVHVNLNPLDGSIPSGIPIKLLETLPALHVLHNDARLNLWPDWLEKAGLPAHYADNGIEFSTLEQAIHAARKGAGLAIVDRNMIVEELGENSLAPMSEIEVSGPYGYWLDIAPRHAPLEHVQAFASWLREQVLGMT